MEKKLTREELLKFCRHYDPATPDEDLDLMASYEKRWIEFTLDDPEYITRLVEAYVQEGLEDFNTDDGVPISMKALLFGRFAYWQFHYTAEDFKDWYRETYL